MSCIQVQFKILPLSYFAALARIICYGIATIKISSSWIGISWNWMNPLIWLYWRSCRSTWTKRPDFSCFRSCLCWGRQEFALFQPFGPNCFENAALLGVPFSLLNHTCGLRERYCNIEYCLSFWWLWNNNHRFGLHLMVSINFWIWLSNLTSGYSEISSRLSMAASQL